MLERTGQPEHLPQGAVRGPDAAVTWRIWAPSAERVRLVTWPDGRRREHDMQPEGGGYFTCQLDGVDETLRYAYLLADGVDRPDPASRWQPEGVHRPSATLFPGQWRFDDGDWQGVSAADLVIYELHVGTFTPEGTFDAVIPRLAELGELGVTAIELMPVAQCPGDRGWGYEGAFLYAVQQSYGGPHGLKRLVEAAHRAGLAVLLDVVYNHLGPEGNYLSLFGPYFTERYHTPWGAAVNFDGPHSDAVRQFVIDNACMWVRDYHLDGLRLDAVHAIYDASPRHILAEIQQAVQREAARAGRTALVIAETSANDARLVHPAQRGGYALDGIWSDDFHHSVHTLLTGQRDGYYLDFGQPRHLAKALAAGFVYDGCYSPFRQRRHGSSAADIEPHKLIVCIQNHDQVGNRARGERLAALVPPAAQRLACGLLLLSPYTPLLFMGEEYGETRPFPFFCSFGDAALVEAVRRGRREEFAALDFHWQSDIPDPQDFATFQSAVLQWTWPEATHHAGLRRLYADLLRARRAWPALAHPGPTTAEILASASDGPAPEVSVLVLQRGASPSLLAAANLSGQPAALPQLDLAGRMLLISTEDPRYHGDRRPGTASDWFLPYELLVFGAQSWR